MEEMGSRCWCCCYTAAGAAGATAARFIVMYVYYACTWQGRQSWPGDTILHTLVVTPPLLCNNAYEPVETFVPGRLCHHAVNKRRLERVLFSYSVARVVVLFLNVMVID